MKKLFTILTVALALVAVASCSNQEEFGNPAGEMVKVTYSLEGPAGVATKAMGEVTSDYKLFYEVRLWDGATLGSPLTGAKLSGNQTVTAAQWPVNIEFNLARNKQYKILFWAQSVSVNAPVGLYTIDAEKGLTKVTIDYSKMKANNEDCDVFCGYDVITPAGSSAVSLTLSRPLALLNLGTSDAAEYRTASGNCEVGKVSATVTGTMGTGINVATGDITTGSVTIKVEEGPIDAYNAKTLAVGASSYNYLNAVYFIPGADLVSVSYTISDNQETPALITATPLQVTNVPVAANYRTNIVGKLLTGTIEYNITLDEFDGVKNKIDNPSFASIAALNAYFASGLATGPTDPDNGDIFLESVTVAAIGEDKTIILPNDTLSVAITILASYSGADGLTIAYSTAEGAKHSNNVFFNMAGLSKLTANLPDTHMEIVTGSDIDLSDVHTSAGTFVIQKGARVGTLNINKGNAKIAGAAENVNVIAGATADGEDPGADNAVQVFLAKDAAVEQINLAAKSDVVVEQPANHIEVDATERKVCVNIASSATGSTALAQNGGQIYVKVAGDVGCSLNAEGQSAPEEGSVPSQITIAEVGTDSVVTTETPATVVEADGAEIDGTVATTGNCFLYTPGVEASLNESNVIVFQRVKNGAKASFSHAVANAVAGQVIELSEDIDMSGSTIELAGGVAIDFAGHTLTAAKVVGNNGKVLFKQSKKYSSVNTAAEEVAAGYLSYVGSIENVEIWGGTYAFDPQAYTPSGIALVADGADFNLSGKWFVPAIPEAIVYHGTQAEMDANDIEFKTEIWAIKRDNDGATSRYPGHPFDGASLPVENGAYAFLAEDDESPLTTQSYEGWYADYIVSVDKKIEVAGMAGEYPIPSWGIWGAYGGMAYAPAFCFDLEANERVPLLGSMGLGLEYNGIRSFVRTFICGAVNVHPANVGKVVTAELCIAPKQYGDKYYGNMQEALADGKVIVVCKYQYTMEEPYYDITNPNPEP